MSIPSLEGREEKGPWEGRGLRQALCLSSHTTAVETSCLGSYHHNTLWGVGMLSAQPVAKSVAVSCPSHGLEPVQLSSECDQGVRSRRKDFSNRQRSLRGCQTHCSLKPSYPSFCFSYSSDVLLTPWPDDPLLTASSAFS